MRPGPARRRGRAGFDARRSASVSARRWRSSDRAPRCRPGPANPSRPPSRAARTSRREAVRSQAPASPVTSARTVSSPGQRSPCSIAQSVLRASRVRSMMMRAGSKTVFSPCCFRPSWRSPGDRAPRPQPGRVPPGSRASPRPRLSRRASASAKPCAAPQSPASSARISCTAPPREPAAQHRIDRVMIEGRVIAGFGVRRMRLTTGLTESLHRPPQTFPAPAVAQDPARRMTHRRRSDVPPERRKGRGGHGS